MLLSVFTAVWNTGCKNKSTSKFQTENNGFQVVDIKTDNGFFDTCVSSDTLPGIVILKEDDKTMFEEPTKIVATLGKFFIMDRFDARCVVSFTDNGEPYARYGNVGNGPGEYMFPCDINVDKTGVYILDSNQKKIIKYSLEGRFENEIQIDFLADSFELLEDNKTLFQLFPENKRSERLIITDRSTKSANSILYYPKDYTGGWLTPNPIRKNPEGFNAYIAPSDTLYKLDSNGYVSGGIVFDFHSKAVPESGKKDFYSISDNMRKYLMFSDNPIMVRNNLWIGTLWNDKSQFTVIYNPIENKCGAREITSKSSVFDILEPMCVTDRQQVVSILNEEIASGCEDYSILPSNIKSALEGGFRVLTLHTLVAK